MWTLRDIYRGSSRVLGDQKPNFKYPNLGAWKYHSLFIADRGTLGLVRLKIAFVNANSSVPPTFKNPSVDSQVWFSHT